MKEFYNENGKHKDTKYYYGKTSESKWIKKRGDLIMVNMGTWLFVWFVFHSYWQYEVSPEKDQRERYTERNWRTSRKKQSSCKR